MRLCVDAVKPAQIHAGKDLETCLNEHGDEGTTDFLTGLMQSHEKTAWMLRAYLR